MTPNYATTVNGMETHKLAKGNCYMEPSKYMLDLYGEKDKLPSSRTPIILIRHRRRTAPYTNGMRATPSASDSPPPAWATPHTTSPSATPPYISRANL